MIRNYANEANLIRGFHKCVRFNGRGKNDTFSLDNSSQSRKVAVESMINKGYITKKSNKVNFVGKFFYILAWAVVLCRKYSLKTICLT